jgi:hypothetical protein
MNRWLTDVSASSRFSITHADMVLPVLPPESDEQRLQIASSQPTSFAALVTRALSGLLSADQHFSHRCLSSQNPRASITSSID